MAVEVEPEAGRPIPVTCFTGFLGGLLSHPYTRY